MHKDYTFLFSNIETFVYKHIEIKSTQIKGFTPYLYSVSQFLYS